MAVVNGNNTYIVGGVVVVGNQSAAPKIIDIGLQFMSPVGGVAVNDLGSQDYMLPTGTALVDPTPGLTAAANTGIQFMHPNTGTEVNREGTDEYMLPWGVAFQAEDEFTGVVGPVLGSLPLIGVGR